MTIPVPAIRHTGSGTLAALQTDPHRPFTPAEIARRNALSAYLDSWSEDQLIEDVLLPLFRHLGYHRISAAGHTDKALEYGKDIWMRFTLPTQHRVHPEQIPARPDAVKDVASRINSRQRSRHRHSPFDRAEAACSLRSNEVTAVGLRFGVDR